MFQLRQRLSCWYNGLERYFTGLGTNVGGGFFVKTEPSPESRTLGLPQPVFRLSEPSEANTVPN
jgi:hypothetical protein